MTCRATGGNSTRTVCQARTCRGHGCPQAPARPPRVHRRPEPGGHMCRRRWSGYHMAHASAPPPRVRAGLRRSPGEERLWSAASATCRLVGEDGLDLGHVGDVAAAVVGQVRANGDRRAAHVQRLRRRRQRAGPHRSGEHGAGRNGGGARTVRQIEERAHGAGAVGQGHDRAAVQYAAGRRPLGGPGEPTDYLVLAGRDELDPGGPREGHEGEHVVWAHAVEFAESASWPHQRSWHDRPMTLVAGVDSSTQACKVVIRDAETGALVHQGRAPHPDGTEVDPSDWWAALEGAVSAAGGLDDVAAISVGGQQHGMVCLDGDGAVVRKALLWNDTRSARAGADLTEELGGPAAWAQAVGSVPVASFTVTKLRWLAEHEPANAARTAAVCLPHDWLSRQLGADLATDRSDASGTGYWSPATGEYRPDLLRRALGHDAIVPRVLGPSEKAGETTGGAVIGPGAGDNAAAALGIDARQGDVVVSIGTSGTVFATTAAPTADPSGTVAGFASATGDFLPLVATLNAARVLDAAAKILEVDHAELAELAMTAPPGAGGLTLVPYFEGERTPDRPHSTAALHGLQLANSTPAHLARAAVEGLLCGLADGLDALVEQGVAVERVILVGGGARSAAVQRIAPAIFARPVTVPEPGEYVADGAARQAAWVLTGARPHW